MYAYNKAFILEFCARYYPAYTASIEAYWFDGANTLIGSSTQCYFGYWAQMSTTATILKFLNRPLFVTSGPAIFNAFSNGSFNNGTFTGYRVNLTLKV